MKKLIILTGISGTGKTTLSKYIQKNIDNTTIITVDEIFEKVCEIIGFHNERQKKANRTIALNCFKKMLEECMKREDKIIVIDYPFKIKWRDFFNKITEKYGYDTLTVKLYGESFEEVYKRACIRDLSSQRNIIHEVSSYIPSKKGKNIERKVQSKNLLKEIYENEARTNFIIGNEMKLISKDQITLEQCFNKIKNWILYD